MQILKKVDSVTSVSILCMNVFDIFKELWDFFCINKSRNRVSVLVYESFVGDSTTSSHDLMMLLTTCLCRLPSHPSLISHQLLHFSASV